MERSQSLVARPDRYAHQLPARALTASQARNWKAAIKSGRALPLTKTHSDARFLLLTCGVKGDAVASIRNTL